MMTKRGSLKIVAIVAVVICVGSADAFVSTHHNRKQEYSLSAVNKHAGPSSSLQSKPTTSTTKRFVSNTSGNHDPSSLDNNDSSLEYALRGDTWGTSSDDFTTSFSSYPGAGYQEVQDQAEDKEPLQDNRALIDNANTFLRIFYNSFKNVEGMANGLLKENPMMAMMIFVGGGVISAYMLGTIMLSGYDESWNPVQNGNIPYWDDEVLILNRKIH